jgi:hypothetical protein
MKPELKFLFTQRNMIMSVCFASLPRLGFLTIKKTIPINK